MPVVGGCGSWIRTVRADYGSSDEINGLKAVVVFLIAGGWNQRGVGSNGGGMTIEWPCERF